MKASNFLGCAFGSFTTDGLVDLGGVGVDYIPAFQYPWYVNLKFYARMESEVSDIPGHHVYNLRLMGEDKEIDRMKGDFTTSEEKPHLNLLVDFMVRFDTAGSYRVDLIIDEKPAASWALKTQAVPGLKGPTE